MTDARATDDEVSLADLAWLLLRRWRLIAGCAAAATLIAVGAGVARDRLYSSSTAFIAQPGRGQATALTGVAAQLGLSVPGMEAYRGPHFYADFVRSRQVLGATADGQYRGRDGQSVGLPDLLEIREDSPAKDREATVECLRDRVSAVADNRTGVVTVTVRMPDPTLARDVAVRLVELLNDFNLRVRQSQAKAEREFAQRRLEEAKGELRESEDQMQAFLQQNRDYRSSPALAFAASRLERAVTLRQQIVLTLAQAFEQSRIDEVRDTPVITVVETAEVPVQADSRGLAVLVVLGLIGGTAIGIAVVLALATRRSHAAQ